MVNRPGLEKQPNFNKLGTLKEREFQFQLNWEKLTSNILKLRKIWKKEENWSPVFYLPQIYRYSQWRDSTKFIHGWLNQHPDSPISKELGEFKFVEAFLPNHPDNAFEVLKSHVNRLYPKATKRLLPLKGNKNLMSLLAQTGDKFIASVYDPILLFGGTEINFCPPRTNLSYHSKNLVLTEKTLHQISLKEGVDAFFKIAKEGVYFSITKGHLFTPIRSGVVRSIEDLPNELLFQIQKFESLFIAKTSDPRYLDILEKLKCVKLELEMGDPMAFSKAKLLLGEVRGEFSDIYGTDEYIELLVGNIEYLMVLNKDLEPPLARI